MPRVIAAAFIAVLVVTPARVAKSILPVEELPIVEGGKPAALYSAIG